MNEEMTTGVSASTDDGTPVLPATPSPEAAVTDHGTHPADAPCDPASPTREQDTDTQALRDDSAVDAEAAVYLPVYKGKVIPVNGRDREEITTLLQLGMKQREMMPLMEELTAVAARCGAKSIKELVTLVSGHLDAVSLKKAVDAYGEEDGRRFFENEKALAAATRTQAPPEPTQTVEQYLAQEFEALKKAYPAYRSFADVPKEAVLTAFRENIRLTDAVGRYESALHAAREQTRAHSRRQATASVGTLSSAAGEPSDAVMDAFVKGLRGRL